MSLIGAASSMDWQRCTPTFISTLRVLDFPFNASHGIFDAASSILRIGAQGHVLTFVWCYVRREVGGRRTSFDISSLSAVRVRDLPVAMERMSEWFRFRNSKPRSISRQLWSLGGLLSWADGSQNEGRFEALLSDSDLALEALRGYHTYLRNRVQSHQLAAATAGHQDQDAIACMSEIHGRDYRDNLEPLSATRGNGTAVPITEAVQEFASTLQAIFDSAVKLLHQEAEENGVLLPKQGRLLRLSASDDSRVVELKASYSTLRLLDLACMAFAGLAFVDSGANLAVLQLYEEPKDLEEQLSRPDRINLKQKALKFRAGGRAVEVHLSITTVNRLRTYLRLRQRLIDLLGGPDIAPMFVQCAYKNPKRDPVSVCALNQHFLTCLRRKVAAVGAVLPGVTLRQLRAYKQQDLIRRAPVAIAAKVMGHSVQTALKAYSNAQEHVRQKEISAYLSSLQKTVLVHCEGESKLPAQKVIPIGTCVEYGNPAPSGSESEVQPDCNKAEGCFFCDNYRVHADEQDLRKLLSCRRVLKYILPLGMDSVRAERVYFAVVGRIDALLGEIKLHQLEAYEAARVDVEERGQLTSYWSKKLQQLHLLGMLPTK